MNGRLATLNDKQSVANTTIRIGERWIRLGVVALATVFPVRNNSGPE